MNGYFYLCKNKFPCDIIWKIWNRAYPFINRWRARIDYESSHRDVVKKWLDMCVMAVSRYTYIWWAKFEGFSSLRGCEGMKWKDESRVANVFGMICSMNTRQWMTCYVYNSLRVDLEWNDCATHAIALASIKLTTLSNSHTSITFFPIITCKICTRRLK